MVSVIERRIVDRGAEYRHTPSSYAMVRRICSVVRGASPEARRAGEVWYDAVAELLDTVAEHYGIDAELVRGVFAETSPRVSVATNVWMTVAACELAASGRPVVGNVKGLRDRVRAAARVLSGDTSNLQLDPDGRLSTSRKVRSFWANLSGDTEAVTVDVWAARIAGCSHPDGQPSGGSYVAVAEAYRRAAARLGMTPREVQAVAWCAFRQDVSGQDAEEELAALRELVAASLV